MKRRRFTPEELTEATRILLDIRDSGPYRVGQSEGTWAINIALDAIGALPDWGGEKMKVKLDDGAFIPERAHPTDAGLDLRSPIDYIIRSKGAAWIDTGVHIQLPHGTVGLLKSKSGLNVKHGITSEGVVDEGYTGSIMVKLYNLSDTDYEVRKGDKVSQLLVMPCNYVQCVEVDELDESERGCNGFGSTGR